MSLRIIHDLLPYMRLGTLLLLAAALAVGMARSVLDMLPGRRARLTLVVVALLLLAVLVCRILQAP